MADDGILIKQSDFGKIIFDESGIKN